MESSDWHTGTHSAPVRLPDNRRLHLRTSGPTRPFPSTPAVIIEHGLGGSSLEWVAAERLIARFARVYVYERAGYVPSDPPAAEPTAAGTAADLRALLNAIDVKPPYVLVGHSYGGVLVRQCALDWPQGWVQGLVIVDSAPVRNAVYEGWTEMLGSDGRYAEIVGLERERVLSDEEWAAVQERDGLNAGIASQEAKSSDDAAMLLSDRFRNLEAEGRSKPLLGDARVSAICCMEANDFRKVLEWGTKRDYGSETCRKAFLASIETMEQGDEKGMREHLQMSRVGRFVMAEGRQRTHNVMMVDPGFVAKEVAWVITGLQECQM